MPAPRNDSSRDVSAFFAASALRCSTSSGSDNGGSRSSSRSNRTPSGICSKSSSIEETPILSSIASRSASVTERKLTPLLLGEQRPIRLRLEERVDLARIREPDPDEPTVAVRILVHGLRLLDDLLVDGDDLARERRDHVGHGLDRFHLAVGRVLRDRCPLVRRLVVDKLPERVLGEPRDPECRLVSLDARPVVLGVVLQLVRIRLARRQRLTPPCGRSAS